MSRAKSKSTKTTLNFDPEIKAEAIRLAHKLMGKSGSLSAYLSILVKKESEQDRAKEAKE